MAHPSVVHFRIETTSTGKIAVKSTFGGDHPTKTSNFPSIAAAVKAVSSDVARALVKGQIKAAMVRDTVGGAYLHYSLGADGSIHGKAIPKVLLTSQSKAAKAAAPKAAPEAAEGGGSAYTRFVKSYFAQNAGKTMADAAAAWRAKGGGVKATKAAPKAAESGKKNPYTAHVKAYFASHPITAATPEGRKSQAQSRMKAAAAAWHSAKGTTAAPAKGKGKGKGKAAAPAKSSVKSGLPSPSAQAAAAARTRTHR